MITIEEALAIILSRIKPLKVEEVELSGCLDRVLGRDIAARDDIPPFANSAMDGFAVRRIDTSGASPDSPVVLTVMEDLPAGRETETEVGPGETIRIMTGAPLPPGADSVVKVEDTAPVDNGGGDKVRIFQEAGEREHVRRAGESVENGDIVLRKGIVLRPPEIGMLAALGYPRVPVYPRPRVTIISTGDELQEIDEKLRPGKIRDCNRYSLASAVKECGGKPATLGIAPDRKEDLKKILTVALSTDLVITSGGVSVGKYDLVREALEELGGELLIDKISMKPGKPLTFSMVGDIPVFSLPGNPVSVLVSFLQFVRPALLKMQGKTRLHLPDVEAVLTEDCHEETDRTHLVRVKVERKNGKYYARPTGPQGSGILRSLVLGNGLMLIPPDQGPLKKGEKVKVILIFAPRE